MNPINTIPYAEFIVEEYLNKKKILNTSSFIPSSLQQKGIDFILYKYDNIVKKNKICTVQVKMSRAYENTKWNNYLWFNRITVQPNADWYILVGIYPKQNINTDKVTWNNIMLAFTNSEMTKLMDTCRLKKNNKAFDSKFAFGFDDEKDIKLVRGCDPSKNVTSIDMTKYLISNRLGDISRSIK